VPPADLTHASNRHRLMNVVLHLPNWIGDVVMATPTIRALRQHFGTGATLTGIMRPDIADVLAGTDWLDETIYFDRRSQTVERRARAVVGQLRRLRPDVIVLFPNSLSSGLLAWRSGARRRIGYARNGRSPLLTHRLRHPRSGRSWTPVSAVDAFLELAYAVGCPPQSRQLELATRPEDERTVDQIWDRLDLSRSRQVVIFNTGGAFGAAKDWPGEYFVELAQRTVADHDAAVLVICGPGERDNAARIEKQAAHPRILSMADQDLSLGVAKACVRRSQLMVTTDSGPRQFAAAFRVPVVSLFGPIDPRWSLNDHPGETRLQHAVECGPCGERVCPLGHHQCMRDLTVDRVYHEVAKKLHANLATQAA